MMLSFKVKRQHRWWQPLETSSIPVRENASQNIYSPCLLGSRKSNIYSLPGSIFSFCGQHPLFLQRVMHLYILCVNVCTKTIRTREFFCLDLSGWKQQDCGEVVFHPFEWIPVFCFVSKALASGEPTKRNWTENMRNVFLLLHSLHVNVSNSLETTETDCDSPLMSVQPALQRIVEKPKLLGCHCLRRHPQICLCWFVRRHIGDAWSGFSSQSRCQ